VRNQRDATRVSQYLAATKEVFKRGGDLSKLKKFEGQYIVDADGVKHHLETDPQAIYDAHERIEHPEVAQDVYRWR